MTDSTTVDILSLEDFQATLDARLSEIESVIAGMRTRLAGHPPALGTFADGVTTSGALDTLRQELADRAERLRQAILTTKSATATIIGNYRATESAGQTSAAAIAATLDGIDVALGDGVAGA
jgi:hypothetical protein